MAELKTKVTTKNPLAFLKEITDDVKRTDSITLLKLFADVTKEKPKMWGTSIIGFGQYHYKSERSTQEGDWPLTGFSPRKQNITIYIMPGFKAYGALLTDLGKYTISGGSCLYIKKLADIDIKILSKLIKLSVKDMRKKYHL